MSEIEAFHANTSIRSGGHWFPSHCTARYRVAIIIPYRNRDMQLRIFLNFMHTFLQKQQLDYRIFLVEPVSLEDRADEGTLMSPIPCVLFL